MAIVTEAIDGDTFRQQDEEGRGLADIRVSNVNTPESVHRDSSKNTDEGREASKFMKAVSASGNMRPSHDYGRDHYNRQVGGVKKTINGVDIDMGFVAMTAGYSSYETRFGKAKDPTLHKNYSEFWSDKMPYQAGNYRLPMKQEDWQEMADAHVSFNEAYTELRNGDKEDLPELQEKFDQALYNLHKDQDKVAHFQHVNAGWGREVNEDNVTNSDTDSILFAIADDPEAMERYNRTMRQTGLTHVKYPEQEAGFLDKFGATFSQMGSIANHFNARKTGAARLNKEEYNIPVEEFTEGLPENFHTAVLEEVDIYGEAAGLEKRRQILEDIESHKITDDMPWYTSIGYGLLTAAVDPASYIAGFGVYRGTQIAEKSVATYQLASGIQGRMWATSGLFKNTAKVATYAAGGAAESAAVMLPQLGGDHLYTARSYAIDVAAGAVLGTGLGLVTDGVVSGVASRKIRNEQNLAHIRELEAHMDNPDAPTNISERQVEQGEEIVNAHKSQETVQNWIEEVGGNDVGIVTPTVADVTPTNQTAIGHTNQNQTLSKMKFTPWEVVTKISPESFEKLGPKIRKLFKRDSHLGILIGQQTKLNESKFTPEQRELVAELNSEVTHLASIYPDGKVPKSVEEIIQGVGYTQKNISTVNVIDQVLQGKSANQAGLLGKYIEKLENVGAPEHNLAAIKELRKKLKRAENDPNLTTVDIEAEIKTLQEIPKPMTSLDFYARFSDIMNMERKADKDDLFTLTQDVPKEVSFIKDMLEMNIQARKSKDADFTKKVERLNGIVAKKLDDLDAQSKAEILRTNPDEAGLTAIFNQQTRSHGKTVKLTGDEIIARLKQEGIQQKTPQWEAAEIELASKLKMDGVKQGSKEWKNAHTTLARQLTKQGVQKNSKRWTARFAELKQGSAFVSKEVNKVGKLDKSVVGTHHTEVDVDGPESAFVNDARVELDELNKLPPEKLEEVDKVRMKELQSQIDSQFNDKSKGLEHEADTNDTLPRTLSEAESVNAYKKPTTENLTKLRDKLRSVNKKNGSTVVPKKPDNLATRVKLKKITARLMKSKKTTIDRVIANGTLGDAIDVVRAASTLSKTVRSTTPIKQSTGNVGKVAKSTGSKEAKQLPTKAEVEGRAVKVAALEKSRVAIQRKMQQQSEELERLEVAENERLSSIDARGKAGNKTSMLGVEYRASANAKRQANFKQDSTELREAILTSETKLKDLDKTIELAKAKLERDRLASELPEPKQTTEPTTITPEEVDLSVPVTEKEIDLLVNEPETLTPTEVVEITTRTKAATKQLVDGKVDKLDTGIQKWKDSGGEQLLDIAAAPNGALDYTGRLATRLTKSVGEVFVDSKLTSMKWFGVHVTEIARGFGGKAKRQFSSAVIKDRTFKGSIVKAMPQYRKAVDKYAASKGKGALGRLKARERSGESDSTVKEFGRDLFLVQEYRRQGKPIPQRIDKSVTDFADQFDYYMDHNHNVLVEADAAGFTASRKVKHYIPHIWTKGKVGPAIRKHGREKVVAVLAKGYRNLDDTLTEAQAIKQAETLLENVNKKFEKGDVDPYSPVMDSRAKTRQDIDTTAEVDGLSVMDLLDTDVQSLITKYSHRVGGWVGLAKGTKGLIRSQLDVDTFIAVMRAEAAEKGINVNRHVTMVEDTVAQLLGRPTSNFFSKEAGLAPELRNLADLAVLTKMGGLGSSQLIETGHVMTRTSMMAMSEPTTAAKVLSMGRDGKSDRLLIEEIQGISNITKDLEFFDRQQAHLDQTILEDIGAVRTLSIKIAEKATGGELKAEASRGLGKLTGYNMTRRAQSRVIQGSFVLDIANHFTKGTGVMGNARMADVGLTDTLGVNTRLKSMFTKYAEFDENGVLSKLNAHKWDKDVVEELGYAILRDEAQQIQRTLTGELPSWMNKPLMGLIFQFRQMPIVANSKSLGRAVAFADKEAVTNVVLNTLMAGMVRYSKFALLGTAGAAVVGKLGSDKEVTSEQTQIPRYMREAGIFTDANDLIFGRSGIASIDTDNGWGAFGESTWDAVSGQIPVMGLMNDYYEAGKAASNGDMDALADSAENLMMLGNTALAEIMFEAIHAQIDKLPTKVSLPELPKFSTEVKTRTPKQVVTKPTVEPKQKIEGTMTKPKPKSTKALHGKQAIAKVEEMEGPLNSMEKRIVELEGFSDEEYIDDAGVSTSGVGQTGEFKDKTFKETVQAFVNKAEKTFTNFDTFDSELQTELVQLYYRGDVKSSYNWVKAVNDSDFKDASKQLLIHKEYERRKAVEDDGVTKRLEEASAILAKQ